MQSRWIAFVENVAKSFETLIEKKRYELKENII